MSVRALGIALVLAVAGVLAGYGASALRSEEPRRVPVATPVPAVSPSYPVNEYDVRPDPAVAALAPGLPLRPARLRLSGYRLEAAVPRGWVVGGEPASRIFSAPDNPRNTYYLRIGLLAAGKRSVVVERAARLAALRDAETNEALENLVVEDDAEDTLVVTYLQGGYRRVSLERFLDLGTSTAYATVAVIGRERDRAGMADLLERVAAALRVP